MDKLYFFCKKSNTYCFGLLLYGWIVLKYTNLRVFLFLFLVNEFFWFILLFILVAMWCKMHNEVTTMTLIMINCSNMHTAVFVSKKVLGSVWVKSIKVGNHRQSMCFLKQLYIHLDIMINNIFRYRCLPSFRI